MIVKDYARAGQLFGGIAKFIFGNLQKELINSTGMNDGDIIFIIGDEKAVVEQALGALRVDIAKRDSDRDMERAFREKQKGD